MALADRIRLPTLNLIHRRPRLLKLLAEFVEARPRLITVYAPSGYGKSIVLADFAQTTDLPVCWCSLVPEDRDPTSFLTLLAYSITDRFREIEPGPLLQLVERGNTEASIGRIALSLAEVGSHLIIIDDYHKAVSAGMTLALNKLLEQLPATSTVIVAVRGDMTLATGLIFDLLLADRATGLSDDELRFTGEEIQRVMRKRFGRQISLDTANEIDQATDGNIAQILLAGHMESAQASRMIVSLKERLGDDREIIYSHLAREVFAKQLPDLQRFMLHTSILSDMTVEICNDLLQMSEAQTYLEKLVRKDLFITQIGAGFKYHDLFAEFLRAKLAESEADYRAVILRAAQLLAARSRFEEAINLYLSIQAWGEAAALLEVEWRDFFYDKGRALTLHHWLEQFPDEELINRPWLSLIKGQVLGDDLGELSLAMALYQQAEEQFHQQNNLIGIAEAQVCRSVVLRMSGQAKEALALAASGLSQLENLNAPKREMAYAIRNRGNAYWAKGNIGEAFADLRRALKLYEELNDTYRVGLCHHDIGTFLEKQGNLSGADHHLRQAFRAWEVLGNSNDLANTVNSLGVCADLKGNYEEALEHFQHSLDIARQIRSTRREAIAWASIGDTYLRRRDYVQARQAYTTSTKLAWEASDRKIEVYNLVKYGECSYEQQDLIQALKFANQAKQIAVEIGLNLERGLACALQAKIYVRRAAYEASFDLFEEALTCLEQNDVLEQVKVRLWWSYSYLCDSRPADAFEQLKEAISSGLSLGELLPRLDTTIIETQQLLFHFLHHADTSKGTRANIRLLLAQGGAKIATSKPHLRVFAFSHPYIIMTDQWKQFNQRGRIRRLPEFLLYLILEGQGDGCRWSEVCAALWPDEASNRASNLFHQHLRRLRKGILGADDYIILNEDYYQINEAYFDWCDALAFEDLLERAAQASLEDALSLQLELINLYRGKFLAGFELSAWGAAQQASYETRFLQVVKLTSEQLLKADKPKKALTIINKGLAQDYFREDLHHDALKAYAKLGLYGDLTAHYDKLCKVFEKEFAAPPDPITNQLYQQLMAKR